MWFDGPLTFNNKQIKHQKKLHRVRAARAARLYYLKLKMSEESGVDFTDKLPAALEAINIDVVYSDEEEDIAEPSEDEEDDDEDMEPMEDEEIEEPIEDKSILTNTLHTQAVFCCALSKDGELAATGSQDDSAFVWETRTGKEVFKCTGHRDSVFLVQFNHDDTLLASIDFTGLVEVWNVKDHNMTWCIVGGDLQWAMWHPSSNVILAGFTRGDIDIWRIVQFNSKALPSHAKVACTCAKLLPNGTQLLAGYDDGVITLWNIKETKKVWRKKGAQPIIDIDLNSDGSLVLIAPSADLLKVSDGTKVGSFLMADETDIEVGLFNCKLGIVVTGSISGMLCVWDVARRSIRHQAKIECAVTVMVWAGEEKLLAGGADGAIYVCNVRTGMLLETLTGHRKEILSLKVFEDGKRVLSTSDDNTSKIFELN